MNFGDNHYLDLTTYPEIYRELVYHRNETIRHLSGNGVADRDKRNIDGKSDERMRHNIVASYRSVFRSAVLQVLDRLYSHDSIEAVYDFNNVELNGWSDTEANRLERELQQLQLIIGKLEIRYRLQYTLHFEYDASIATLFLNRTEILKCGATSIKHRLLTTLFSEPEKLWSNEDIEDYFIKKFDYVRDDLRESSITKAANDIKRDVALKAAVSDLLIVTNASVRVNPNYLKT